MAESGLEDWSRSPTEDSATHCSNMSDFPDAIDEEILHIMTKAVKKLGLEWSSPTEPIRSRLDQWFPQSGRRQKAGPLQVFQAKMLKHKRE